MKKKDKSVVFLVYIISAATLLFALALIGFTIANRNRISSQNREYLNDASHKMALNIDAELRAGYDKIKVVAGLLSDNRSKKEIDVEQLRKQMENTTFDFIEFADTEGWDHTVMNTKTYAGDRKYYTEGVLQGKTGMEIVYNSRATHETLLMYYAPVYFNNEEIIGAVIGVYQAANTITRLLSNDYFGERALAFLATPEGRIVASSEGYDPTAVNYIESLPEGGSRIILPDNGWTIVQYFPEKATQAMVYRANKLGYLLAGFLLLLYVIILISVIIVLRERYNRFNSEMHEALTKTENANKAKTTFLNNMSHDIRTPLNAITGFNDMAMRELGKDDEKVRSCLVKVNRSSETLLALINDILEISRIESGKISLTEDKVDIMFSFLSIESMMKEIAREAGIDLMFSFGTIEDKFVYYDSAHVARIFTNLISNAIKFNVQGGWVRVYCEQVGRKDKEHGIYQYTIEDNGIGMSEEFQEHLFEQFAREKTSTVSRIQGTGLGLAMCKDLTELMDGTITCESTQGHGSKFTVTLPFRLQEGRDYAIPNIGTRHLMRDFDGKKVLLVEDNELNSEIAIAMLKEMGFDIATAQDGDIAVQMMKTARPGDYDVILMDIQMPVMDGYEATRQIRELGTEISRIPIIAMTANAFDEDRQHAIDAGMNDHIAKPIDPQKMTLTLAKYLKK